MSGKNTEAVELTLTCDHLFSSSVPLPGSHLH